VSGISTTTEMARDEMATKLAQAGRPGVGAAPAAKPVVPTIERFGGR
jgi:hypothetical protein